MTDDGGDAAGGGCLARRCDRLAIFGAGFADEGAHVDEPGSDQLSPAVDDVGALRHAGGADATFRFANRAVDDEQVAINLEIGRGIDNARAGEQDRAAFSGHHPRPPWRHVTKLARGSISRIRQIPRQCFEHGHAYGNAHFHLLADQ